MNIALAYHKLMDDWADERNLLRRAGAEALKSGYRRVEARWGEKCAAIEVGVRDLGRIEKRREMDVDAPAKCFGRLLANCSSTAATSGKPPCGPWANTSGGLSTSWTLTTTSPPMKSTARTTPSSPSGAKASSRRWESALTMLIGRCTQAFEVLPLVKDVEILRSVLYSGVWAKYVSVRKKRDASFAPAEDGKGERQ